jgi:hypothetical protein
MGLDSFFMHRSSIHLTTTLFLSKQPEPPHIAGWGQKQTQREYLRSTAVNKVAQKSRTAYSPKSVFAALSSRSRSHL